MSNSDTIASKFAKIAAKKEKQRAAMLEPIPAFQGYEKQEIGPPTRLLRYAERMLTTVDNSPVVDQKLLNKIPAHRYDIWVKDVSFNFKYDKNDTVKLFKAIADDIKSKGYV